MKSVLTLIHTYRTYLITTLFAVTLFVLDISFAFAGVLDDIAGNIMGGFATVIGGGVLLIGGLLLDNSINILVVGMGSFLNGSFGIAVNNLWVVIRDVFNILFIFGLIYIGIKTILNSDSSNTQRTLVNLIIAALFINFSLYITQAIVDVSNILSLQIYNQITTSGEVNVFDIGTIGGISGVFMQASNLTSLFGLKTSGFFYAFFTLWFFIIAGLVFAWGAILLVTRFVALVLYMIFSPIMFLGWILPSLSSYTKKWWDGFLKQCFFAPAFLFMLFLSVVVLDTLSIQGKSGTGFFGMFLSFAVIIGFLIASIKVAQMAGAYGSKSVGKLAGAATFGIGARMGRTVIGGFGQKFADSEKLKEAASQKGFGGDIARAKLKGARMVSDASFDVRNVGGVGKKMGIGEGKKGGYKTRRDEVVKKEEAFSKSLGEIGDDDKHVKGFIDDKKRIETTISDLKIEKDVETDPAAKKELAKHIRTEEGNLKKVDTNLKQERQRRQTGSSRDAQNSNAVARNVANSEEKLNVYKKEKERLNKLLTEVATEDNRAEVQVIEEKIKETTKKIAQEKKTLRETKKENKNLGGYAGVLEESGILVSALSGRTPDQNRKAGKKIRNTNERKIKNSKEDNLMSTLTEEVKNSKQSD